MRCPFCAAPNRAGASFCIECGESFDAATLAAGPGRAPPEAAPGRGGLPAISLSLREVLLGVGLLCAVLLMDRWNTEQQAARDRQAAAYRQGIAAVGAQHWAAAVTAFTTAGDYQDATRRRAAAQVIVTALAQREATAAAAGQAGAWWAATLDYAAMATIQPDYPALDRRWAAARAAAGALLYRVPAGPGDPALWWSHADGSDPRPIPNTDANSQVHAVSADGHWAIYSTYIEDRPEHHLRVPHLLDLRTGVMARLDLPPGSPAGVVSAQFRTDSSGFWWQVEDQLYYAVLPTATPWTPSGGITLVPCAPGIVARDPVQGRTILLDHDQHTPAPGIPAWLDPPESTAVLLGDAWGQHTHLLVREVGTVAEMTISPGGRYFAYRVTQPLPDSRGVEDALVLFDTSLLKYYPGSDLAPGRHEIDSVRVAQREWLYHTLRARFLPGATPDSPRLLITQSDASLAIYDPATGVRQPLTTRATGDGTWHLGATPPVVSPGGRWLALEVWSATGTTILSQMVVQPTTGGAAWTTLVPADLPTWIGFSGDAQYAFYALSSFTTSGEQHSRLLSVPVPDGRGGPSNSAITTLLDHRLPSPSWLRNVALTPDGRHLLALVTPMQTSAVPGDGAHAPGLYALRPDGHDWLLVAPAAIEFWVAAAQPWSVSGVQ